MLFFTAVFFAASGIVTASNGDGMMKSFVELQELLRERRSVLGEASYECYSSGACALEFRQQGLLTFREELLCARSEQGCGDSLVSLRKRETECSFLHEEMQLCKRSAGEECGYSLLQAMDEQGCAEVIERKKRSECAALVRRSAEMCGAWGSARKRSVSEECAAVAKDMEEMECVGLQLEKRDGSCDAGWEQHKDQCYKYFAGPLAFKDAQTHCENINGRLATPEKLIAETPADREFFDNLIQSSGTKDLIDSVLGDMDDHFGGQNWDQTISYYDNWAWINVKMSDDGQSWIWNPSSGPNAKNNPVKIGLSDWAKKQPSFDNDVGNDGKCVVYFHNTGADSEAADNTVEAGAWWNTNCHMTLPFFCETDAN